MEELQDEITLSGSNFVSIVALFILEKLVNINDLPSINRYISILQASV